MTRGERQEIQGAATRMNVQHDVRQRQQSAVEVISDFLGHRAIRFTGKTAIQVALVDRRRPSPGMKRRRVHERDDDHPALHLGRRQALRELAQCDRAFVFVTVVAATEQRGRPLTALNYGDGNHDGAPG